ncbi:hypothetical protein [Cobetia crustatorum]|uniref:hypothetical protein n=1 Tax=Cobetia crustatorum TaxID=553385 RepID=UPI0012EB4AED|nr:hypothetical protein [Cobetia crustatorum]
MSKKKYLKPASVLAAALTSISTNAAVLDKQAPEVEQKLNILVSEINIDRPITKEIFIIERPMSLVQGVSLAYHTSHRSHSSHSSHSSHRSHSSHYSSSY